jgi:tetratricopeptide (TPR) repeat protein
MIRFLLVVILGISFSGFSQTTKVKFFDKLASSKYISDGSEMYNVGRTSDALMFFRQAKVKNPTNWKAYFWLATTEFELNSYDQALMNASKALELTKEKSDGELQLLLGKINHKLNMIESAITHFKNAKIDFGDKLAVDYDIPIYLAQCEFALNEQKNGVQNKRITFSSKLNTKYDEYAPILIDGGKQLFFTARNSETTGGNLNPEDQRFF